MRQNGSAAWIAILVLALFGIAAWFVLQPEAEPELRLADAPLIEPAAALAQTIEPIAAQDEPSASLAEQVETATGLREEVRVVPEGSILVRVLGPEEQALEHVVVAVGMQRPGERTAMRLGSGRTDSEGYAIVKLDHAYRLRVAAFPPNPELMIDARFASNERVRVLRLLNEAEAGETMLRLPETRLVEILTTLPDGGRVDFPVSVSAAWAPADTPGDSELWRTRRAEPLPVVGNRAYLVAGFDVDIELNCWDSTQRYASASMTVPGPRAGDPARVQREIALGELVPRLRARLLNESGEPMTGARISLYQSLVLRPSAATPDPDTKPETKWVKNLDVGADGWVEMEFYVNEYTKRFDRRWSFVLAASALSSSLPGVDEQGAVQASFDVPREIAPGAVHEAGELIMRLLSHPLIVSGRCLTPSGSRGAAVISVTTNEIDWQKRTRLWQGQPDRDGSFEVRAELPATGEVIVSAGGFGHLGVEQTVPVGTPGLELLMVKGITLRGRLILPDATPWLDTEIRMPGGRAKELVPGGNFSVDYLRPAADSWVSLECNGRELWRSAPILIEGEGDSNFRPAQVQDIDLRGQLRSWSTQIVGEDGKPYGKEFRVQCLTPDGESNGLDVSEDGFLIQLLPNGVDTLQLLVSQGIPIDLSWPPAAQVVLRKSDR
jgi:hypothetical protein